MMTLPILSIYPNCSLGGMSSVFKNRAKANPLEKHVLFFKNDLSGASTFSDISNLSFRIVTKGRFDPFLRFATSAETYEQIRITSLPEIPKLLSGSHSSRVIYEFHTSDESIIARELGILDLDSVDEIWTPSHFLAGVVRSQLDSAHHALVRVESNLVDLEVFSPRQSVVPFLGFEGKIPLVWIGRFDKGKNVRDFLRVLSRLPRVFVGIVIVSFETQPDRISSVLADAAQYGLNERMTYLLNISQVEIADLYRYVASQGGILCSTSLGESFGYSVAEAIASGLGAVAYDVGAISELCEDGGLVSLVSVGDLEGMTEEVLRRTSFGSPF